MKPATYISLTLLIAFVGSGCSSTHDPVRRAAGAYRNYTDITGTITENRYVSPDKNFACTVPKLLSPGAQIYDNVASETGGVAFQDDLGTLVRVDYFTIPPERVSEATTIEGRKALATQSFDGIVATLYRTGGHDAQVIHREFIYLQDGHKMLKDVALYGIVFLPKGSTIKEATKGPLDAFRASLLFVRGTRMYMLTIQDTPVLTGGGPGKETEADFNQRLQKRLEDFYATCSCN